MKKKKEENLTKSVLTKRTIQFFFCNKTKKYSPINKYLTIYLMFFLYTTQIIITGLVNCIPNLKRLLKKKKKLHKMSH